jgi:hypothetical protein
MDLVPGFPSVSMISRHVKDILLSRVMMGVGIIFLVLHLPRTLLALYEVTRIPRILTCMVHGCRQGSLYPSFFLYSVSC